MLESTYHGVPMICSPFFGDQPHNALAAKRAGFAEVVDLDTTSTEEFFNLIQKVLTDPRLVSQILVTYEAAKFVLSRTSAHTNCYIK